MPSRSNDRVGFTVPEAPLPGLVHLRVSPSALSSSEARIAERAIVMVDFGHPGERRVWRARSSARRQRRREEEKRHGRKPSGKESVSSDRILSRVFCSNGHCRAIWDLGPISPPPLTPQHGLHHERRAALTATTASGSGEKRRRLRACDGIRARARRGAATGPAAAPPPASAAGAKTFSQQDLDRLLAPIALYPDALLVQILMASTYPLEIVSARAGPKANPGVKDKALEDAMQKQTWDPA
jgi:hypothetical protein